MSRGTLSGWDVAKVITNSGIVRWDRTNGDHAILVWEPPDSHDSERRVVPVPLHDEVREGTLRRIAEQAGATDFDEFYDWIDRNR
jgi:predicted RNA binding protein YcfA (HicA-like mRNA interferase family)